MNTSKSAIIASAAKGKIASIVGYCGIALFLLGAVLMLLDSGLGTAIVGFVIAALFIPFIRMGSTIKKRIKRFKQYVSLISNQKMILISDLASATRQSASFVRDDLATMISKNFFTDASLDLTANEHKIVIGRKTTVPIASIPTKTQAEMEDITCVGCGAAVAKLKGESGKCDYCGSAYK